MIVYFSGDMPGGEPVITELATPPRAGDYVSFDGGDTDYRVLHATWNVGRPGPANCDVYVLLAGALRT